ncbi:MAG: DUF1512 family protein, partial [Candidatus Aenigmatarchaeota archaeon]
LILFVFIAVYPRIMLSQMIHKLEQSAKKLEEMSNAANVLVARKSKDTSKENKAKIKEFTDFFVVEPSSLDPYGIVQKLDQTIRQMEKRFDEASDEIAGDLNDLEKRQINYGLRAALTLRQIAKIVRHNVELAKKFKNLQIAMIIQMQMPIIEKIAESELKGTEAFINGWPVGDSIGPLAAASLMDRSKPISEDIVVGTTTIEGRYCFVLKATGPKPSLGRIDDAVQKILKNNKIARVVTIDAMGKFEGEKSGSVAEGVGFAMGGIAQRDLLENTLIPTKKPIDSIGIKVGLTEAILPMRKDIYDALPKVQIAIKRAVRRAKKGQKIIIIGVGNSCGIGDNKKAIAKVGDVVKTLEKKRKDAEKKQKKGSWI